MTVSLRPRSDFERLCPAVAAEARCVVVSAKREGSNITTSVYTDATGNYYFPASRLENTMSGAGARL